MGPLPRSRAVGSIRDERLLGCGRVKTRQRLVERTSRLVKRSSSARHPSVGPLYLGTPDADHKVRPFGPRQEGLHQEGNRLIGHCLVPFHHRWDPVWYREVPKTALSRFRPVPSNILAVLREFMGTPIFNESRIPRAVGNPSLDGVRAPGRPTNEPRVRRFVRGPERRRPIRIQDVAVPPVDP